MKYSFKFKTSTELKNDLFDKFQEMYEKSGRTIEKFFDSSIQKENLKIFLDKLSYIISFISLCISPGEILEYEYKETIKNNLEILNSEYQEYCKDNIDKEIIYYNDKVFLHSENDEFSKYEKQIKENDIKVEKKFEEETSEFAKSCYDEIKKITNDILENKITISNLLLFLENCKKFLMKIPFILTKKENEEQIKECINGSQLIYDYLKALKNTEIRMSNFGKIINSYFEDFENFLSKFPYFKIERNEYNDIISLEYIKKCELPFDDKYEIGKPSHKKYNGVNNSIFMENKYFKDKPEFEQYNTIINNTDNYENKKDLNFKEKDDKYRIINIIEELTGQEKKYISLEGISSDFKNQSNIQDNQKNEIKEKIFLKNDLTDFKEEAFYIKAIRKLYEDKNISTTIILKDIIKIVNQENQKFSLIRDLDKIRDIKIEFDDSTDMINSQFYNTFSYSSSLLQNIISNIIRTKISVYNENEILPKTLINSYIDLLVDISQTMSEEQRVASLLLCTGLSIPLSKYGVKIRISVFGERDNVWQLTDDFSKENILIQLSRLRDSLACLKRIQSFPADALKKLKNTFFKRKNGKYIQILISSLISSQVVDNNINWNELGQRIIIFGLKSNFEEPFLKEYPNLYENILKISTSEKAQIIQEFFESFDIISQSDNIKEIYSKLINPLIDGLLSNNDKKENEKTIREIKINDSSFIKNQNDNNIE